SFFVYFGRNFTINILATGTVDLEGSRIDDDSNTGISSFVGEDAVGNAGEINLTAESLSLTDSAQINAGVFGSGSGGNINLQTTSQITIAGEDSGVFGNVGEDAIGETGELNIVTGLLSLDDDGELNSSTQGRGNAGTINIDAREVSLINSEISTEVDEEAEGNAGNITLLVERSLIIADDAELNSSTNGRGNAGNIAIEAEAINLTMGEISTGVESGAVGNGGNIAIDARTFSLRDESQIFSSVLGATEELPGGRGNGGTIEINASDLVEIVGGNSPGLGTGLFANSGATAEGNPGSITIETDLLSLNRGAIEANNQGQANGAIADNNNLQTNIFLRSNNLLLNNNARISAVTEAGNGGNADISIREQIQLRNNSTIAVGSFGDGDGGNISIDATFIVAFPVGLLEDGNDIIANAGTGMGGNIDVRVDRVFGIEPGLAESGNGRNDFEASARLSIAEETLVNLFERVSLPPASLVDGQLTTAQACRSNRATATQNSFTLSGKGGIPPAPDLPLDSQHIISNDTAASTPTIPPAIVTSQGNIQPARGIKVTASGVIMLTAYPTDGARARLPQVQANCGAV
ncbi:MAG: hypothetical protein AAFQ41_14170, partial [Cyanobacteria bacterium J06623_7]